MPSVEEINIVCVILKDVAHAVLGVTVERLYGMRKPQIDKTDKAREDYEFERMGSECTFKPKRLTQEMPIRSKN